MDMASRHSKGSGDPEQARVEGLRRRFNSLGETLARSRQKRSMAAAHAASGIRRRLDEIAGGSPLPRAARTAEGLLAKAEGLGSGLQRAEARLAERRGSRATRDALDQAAAERRALATEFAREGADRIFAVSLGLNAAQKEFAEGLETGVTTGREMIAALRARLEAETAAREDGADVVASAVLGRLESVESSLRACARERVETTRRLREVLAEVSTELAAQVEEERAERELAGHSLLGLLEESCERIERNFSAKS